MQGRLDEAFASFYKAIWSSAWQDSRYFSLAQIACEKKAYREALELVDHSLIRNAHNYKARDLKAALLRKLGYLEDAERVATETIQLDIVDFGAYNELYLLHLLRGEQSQAGATRDLLTRLVRKAAHNFIALAVDYSHCGLYEEGADILSRLVEDTNQNAYPMLHYYLGYFYQKLEHPKIAQVHRRAARTAPLDYCFPHTLDH